MLRSPTRTPGLEAFKLARQREREACDKISQALVDSFITPIEREDIESLASALYKIPKQVERFADRYALRTTGWRTSTSPRAPRCSNRRPAWSWRWSANSSTCAWSR